MNDDSTSIAVNNWVTVVCTEPNRAKSIWLVEQSRDRERKRDVLPSDQQTDRADLCVPEQLGRYSISIQTQRFYKRHRSRTYRFVC